MIRRPIVLAPLVIVWVLCATVCFAESRQSHPRARPVQGDLRSVDLDRLDDALDACDFLLEHLSPEGRYQADQLWGPEGDLYLYGIISVLVEAYRITGENEYLGGVHKVLNYLQQAQLPSGGWTLRLSGTGKELIL